MTAEPSAQNHDATLVESLLDRQRDSWQRGKRLLVETLLEGHPAVAENRERLLDGFARFWPLEILLAK